MRIALDISSATPGRTGIGAYAYELARRLVACRDHEWILLFNSLRQPPPDLPEFRASHVRLLRRRIPGPALLKSWQTLDWPDIETLTGGPVDLFHSPATYVPPQRRGARVTTLHDLYFLEPGANKAPLGGGYLEWVVKHRLPGTHAILCDAGSIARQCETLMKSRGADFCVVEPEEPEAGARTARPIIPIPLGVDARFFEPVAPARLDRVRQRYDLPQRFALHLGGAEPRKNRDRLLNAFAGWQAPGWNLVLIGRGEPRPGASFRFVPNVLHEDLPALYRLASALVFPSLHEGFGLPVLEAMACGTPVLTSTGVAAVEYLPAGSVATCDAASEESIGAMLETWLPDPQRLFALGSAGPEIAARFTWQETARLTLKAYECAARLAGA